MNHKYTISEINKLVGGTLLHSRGSSVVYDFSIDSRKITGAEKLIFIAINGPYNNGHDYIKNAYDQGVRCFMVEEGWTDFPAVDIDVIQVKDTVWALQQWMAFHRSQFDLPIVGITGSNGKTSVKEWLNLLLADDYRICRSPNSYNSQVGVPISLSFLNDEFQLGIFEAGISQPKEMALLEETIRPKWGILTNIGTSHLNNFESVDQLIDEKLSLFDRCECVFLSDKNQEVIGKLNAKTIPLKIWGNSDIADLEILKRIKIDEGEHVSFSYEGEVYAITSDFTNEASFENMMHCILFMLFLGKDMDVIQDRMSRLKSLPMRLEILEGQDGLTILNDAYTLDLNSLEIALDQMDHIAQEGGKVVILSDWDDSNTFGTNFYEKVGHTLEKHRVNSFIGLGTGFSKNNMPSSIESHYFENKESFLSQIDQYSWSSKTVLIKGSRSNELEAIVKRLQKKTHRTVLEINLELLAQNLKYFKSRLDQEVKLMVMVKAFSYGAGMREIAQVLEFNGVDYLGVAYVDEGIELREEGVSLPIMIMNPESENFDACFRYNLEPEIYSMPILKSYLRQVPSEISEKKYKVHIKLDTGMNRLGFVGSELPELISILGERPEVEIASLLTHLSSSDVKSEDDFSNQQLKTFDDYTEKIEDQLQIKVLKHALNTAGILRFPAHQKDMVRLGIGVYGISPVPEFQNHVQPVATLKTNIAQIKSIEKGDSVGYSREFIADGKMKIAIIPIGYADGFPRALSKGKGQVWIKDKKAKILGNVCMDMTMVDVTDIHCEEGDEVIIFSGKYPITLISTAADTIPYEIMTSLSSRVKRIYVHD